MNNRQNILFRSSSFSTPCSIFIGFDCCCCDDKKELTGKAMEGDNEAAQYIPQSVRILKAISIFNQMGLPIQADLKQASASKEPPQLGNLEPFIITWGGKMTGGTEVSVPNIRRAKTTATTTTWSAWRECSLYFSLIVHTQRSPPYRGMIERS